MSDPPAATLNARLAALAARRRSLAGGAVLFRAGDPVQQLFVVEQGALHLVRALPHGQTLTLQRAHAGAVLAEASVFAERYHCEAVAAEPSTVRAIPMRRLRAALAADAALARAWAGRLAAELQRARTQAELLSLRTVAQRVETWIALNGGALPPKGEWRQVASEIGVTPEALYRELARRRSAGSP